MNKSDADADLMRARTAMTREEYGDILRQLKETTRETASRETEEDANSKSDEVREAPSQI